MSNASGIKMGRAFVEIGANDSELQRTLKSVENRLNSTAHSIRRIGLSLLVGGGAVSGPLAVAAVQAGQLGSALSEVSAKTGVAVEDIGSLQFAAEQTGSSLEGLSKGIKGLLSTVNDARNGSKDATKAFDDLGLTFQTLEGLSPDQQFKVIADRIASIEDPARRSSAATAIFGKAGFELLPMLSKGSAGIQEMEDRFRQLGGEAAVKAAFGVREFGDAVVDTRVQIQAIRTEIGAAIAEAILPYRKSIAETLRDVIDWIGRNKELVVGLGAVSLAIAAVGAAVVSLGIVVSAFSKIASIAVILAGITAPEVLIIAGVLAALAAAIVLLSSGSRDAKNETDDLAESLTRFAKVGDANRVAIIAQTERLQALSGKTVKTTNDLDETRKIVGELEKAFGPLGITINGVTGEITGLDEAIAKLNENMQAQRIEALRKELKAYKEELKAVGVESGNLGATISPAGLGFSTSMARATGAFQNAPPEGILLQKGLDFRAATLQEKIKNLEQQISDLEKGPTKENLTGGLIGAGASIFNPTQLIDVDAIEEAKKSLESLGTEWEKLSKRARESDLGDFEKQIQQINELARSREDVALELMRSEISTSAPGDFSAVARYQQRLGEIAQDRIDATASTTQKRDAENAEIEKKNAADIYDYKLQLELDLANARGEKTKAAAIQAEQFIRNQARAIEDLGLTGQAKTDALARVGELAQLRLGEIDTIRKQITGFSAGIVNSNAIASLNRAGRGNAPGVSELKKNVEQNTKIITLLQTIADKAGLAFGP